MEIVIFLIIVVTVINSWATFKLFKDMKFRHKIVFDNYVESQTRMGYVWRSIQDYETADYVNRKGAYQEIDRNWQHYINK